MYVCCSHVHFCEVYKTYSKRNCLLLAVGSFHLFITIFLYLRVLTTTSSFSGGSIIFTRVQRTRPITSVKIHSSTFIRTTTITIYTYICIYILYITRNIHTYIYLYMFTFVYAHLYKCMHSSERNMHMSSTLPLTVTSPHFVGYN